MKISYSWLREHVELQLPAEELAKHLLALGFEVASIEKKGPAFRGVVTAKILEVAKHPNADRLRLCTVDDGSAQKLTVVCGAPNVAVGQTVPLARVGAELPGGRKLTPAKIRGVESQGMLCSGAELGLGSDHAGILVLGEDTPVGQDFAQRLGPGDDILEVEITPNRPDVLSHRGLARELAAYFGLRLKPVSTLPLPAPSGDCPPISVDAPQACTRYVGRALTGVKIAPSPGWLAAKLESVGLRPINNVVDVTNFMLMDIGQPMHAFDLAKLAGPEIRVRMAKPGESIKALDNKEYKLSEQLLVIADKDKPVAIAGVMGGLDSSVTDKTTSILLESAHFAAPAIRKASQALRLKSDSSYRYERGTDPGVVEAASERAAALLAQLTGGKVSAGRTAGRAPEAAAPIRVTAARVNEILGAEFPAPAIERALEAIAAKLEKKGEELVFTPPTHRGDLATPWDLAEEAARLLGYDNIPSKAAPIPLRAARLTPSEALAEKTRARLASLGLMEAYNYDFVSAKLVERCRLETSGLARMANPLSDDWTFLRPSLLIGLLNNAAVNLNHGAGAVKLFELGKQYRLAGKEVEERAHAAGILLGPAGEPSWVPARSPEAGFHDVKGLVEDLLAGIPGLKWTTLRDATAKLPSDAFFHPSESLRVEGPRGPLGAVGLLHPTLARAWDLEGRAVGLFDLDLEQLVELESPRARFQPYSPFPVSRRDLSLLVDKTLPYARLADAARKGGGEFLHNVQLADVFAGKGLPPGKHSLLLRLTFGSMERTLTDAEVNAAVDGALAALKALGAELRA